MSKAKAFSKSSSPMTPPIFYILLALAIKERHGYDIMKHVYNETKGTINLGPGTLYGAIKRMLEDKLIVALDTEQSRRKYYKLTNKGRTIVSKELQRYNDTVELAKKRNLLINPNLVKITAYE